MGSSYELLTVIVRPDAPHARGVTEVCGAALFSILPNLVYGLFAVGCISGGHSDRVAELALKAFMSMNRAVAIVGPDGELLQPNLVFEKLFGDTELLDRINREAAANNGKRDCRVTLSDGRARPYRWMAGGWSAPTT
jgi:hypothetical protein